MKHTLKCFTIIWVICLAVFNVIVFVTPTEVAGVNKFDGAFWIGYIFITISFIGQLACTYLALKAKTLKKLFYNIPLIAISYTGLAVMLVVGGLTMAIPGLPDWIGIIVCLLTLAFTVISVIKASAAVGIVSDIDEKVAAKTSFVKQLTIEAQNLAVGTNDPIIKEQCKKIYEALRYSDPMSNDALADVERRIKEGFDTLKDVVITDDLSAIESSSKELINLIAERNSKCRSLK